MGKTFENLTEEELCDLMCGGPEEDPEEPEEDFWDWWNNLDDIEREEYNRIMSRAENDE